MSRARKLVPAFPRIPVLPGRVTAFGQIDLPQVPFVFVQAVGQASASYARCELAEVTGRTTNRCS
jgi:hypothetical protein